MRCAGRPTRARHGGRVHRSQSLTLSDARYPRPNFLLVLVRHCGRPGGSAPLVFCGCGEERRVDSHAASPERSRRREQRHDGGRGERRARHRPAPGAVPTTSRSAAAARSRSAAAARFQRRAPDPGPTPTRPSPRSRIPRARRRPTPRSAGEPAAEGGPRARPKKEKTPAPERASLS